MQSVLTVMKSFMIHMMKLIMYFSQPQLWKNKPQRLMKTVQSEPKPIYDTYEQRTNQILRPQARPWVPRKQYYNIENLLKQKTNLRPEFRKATDRPHHPRGN